MVDKHLIHLLVWFLLNQNTSDLGHGIVLRGGIGQYI